MTLNGIVAVILRYFSEFGYLLGILRISSRSLSHLVMSSCCYILLAMLLLQIVHQKGKDLYILFTRWGRIGDRGQHQQTPFPTFDEARKEFRKVFRAKSGNDWIQLPQKPYVGLV